MIQALLKEVEGIGCVVSREMDKLKLHDPRLLTSELKDKLREHKPAILKLRIQQERAKKSGWLVDPIGEVYEKQIGRNSFVYILLEDDGTYTVWRGTWNEKNYPDREKTVIENADFETAFQRAENYVGWFLKKR